MSYKEILNFSLSKEVSLFRSVLLCWKKVAFEPRSEKTGLRGFQPGPTQTGLYNHTRWLEA